jgi:hypothetical protein
MSIPSSFDVASSSGPLGSFLQTASSNGGIFASFATSESSSTSKTLLALGSGGMTSAEHNVIVDVSAGGTNGSAVGWNANGTEPTTLANMRSYGWIQLVKKTDTDGTISGVYKLTAVGKAIAKRTGGGLVGGGSTSSSSSGVSSSTKAAITSGVAAVENILASLGGSSSAGISTGATNSSAVNILA